MQLLQSPSAIIPFAKLITCHRLRVFRPLFLPVRSMRQGYAFVSVYMCVVKKHACLRFTIRNSPQKRNLLPVY